jgi:hypothetical protein
MNRVGTNRPQTQNNEFIRLNGCREYGKWHPGIDDEHRQDTKKRYAFPHGNFKDIHRCAVLSAESRAGQFKHNDIEIAAAHLHGMIDEPQAIGSRWRSTQ